MKKLQLFKSLVLLLTIAVLVSCENEPLTGEFINEQNITADPGQFISAVGDNIFEAETIEAFRLEDGTMLITATNEAGDVIKLSVENADVGSFPLVAGAGVPNFISYVLNAEQDHPYVSLGSQGGNGEIIFTEFNTDDLFISGSIEATVTRQALDTSGNPIFTDDGRPVIEEFDLEGSFNKIPYEDFIEEEQPINAFFAEVDGDDFEPTSITVTRELIADIPVIKIVAVNASNETIRIDIPESTGVGTFNMVDISNGTELIGIYNAGPGEPNLSSNPGTISISQFSTQSGSITGTFQFTGTDATGGSSDQVEVTNGDFTIYYTPEPAAEPFEATIDDVAYLPDNIQTFDSEINEVVYTTVRTIDPDEKEIRISFPSEITTGTYTFVAEVVDGTEVTASYNPDFVDGETTFTSIAGTFVVSSFDSETGEMEASFEFTATDPDGVDNTVYEITDGLFFLEL